MDMVVGTHRLLSKDVEFHDLGLLVVDEEQRFGVRHKERLKQIKQEHRCADDVGHADSANAAHVAAGSAGHERDRDAAEGPAGDPDGGRALRKELVGSAIEQELSRGGQVYFVHNRVDTIFELAARSRNWCRMRIGVGHGQMGEAELEKVLLGFMHHEFDVFVSTTIVENGLDIPLANTMIVENAERHGLSELYQFRGRVGRSNRRAYAYLLTPGHELTEIARKRLAALKEFCDLGAGFKIAALDLELRGAGNMLGGEQNGHIEAVGFDPYVGCWKKPCMS